MIADDPPSKRDETALRTALLLGMEVEEEVSLIGQTTYLLCSTNSLGEQNVYRGTTPHCCAWMYLIKYRIGIDKDGVAYDIDAEAKASKRTPLALALDRAPSKRKTARQDKG